MGPIRGGTGIRTPDPLHAMQGVNSLKVVAPTPPLQNGDQLREESSTRPSIARGVDSHAIRKTEVVSDATRYRTGHHDCGNGILHANSIRKAVEITPNPMEPTNVPPSYKRPNPGHQYRVPLRKMVPGRF